SFLRTPEELEAKKAELSEIDALAAKIYNELLLETESIQANQASDLVMVNRPSIPEAGLFTKRSAYFWLKTTFSLEIHDWAPPNVQEVPDEKKMRADQKRNHQLVIAALVDLFFGEKPGPVSGSMEDPNVAEITRAASKALDQRGVSNGKPALSTIERVLSESLRTRKDHSTTKK
ncbi:hypothetical protein, partial [Luminiphilus syltensis]|uniref:hypothetical protein n=1 Tax=Luminiphilus syltensis TaxID=1341119 RepID=UPI00058B0EED